MAKRARAGSLDAGKKREIAAILSVGCSRATAAKYVGSSAETIRRTAKRDPEFAEQVRRAETGHELRYLQLIQGAAKDAKYWRAAAWALERKYPERYAPRKPQAVTKDEMGEIVRQLGETIAAEVQEISVRRRILARLDQWIASWGEARGEGP